VTVSSHPGDTELAEMHSVCLCAVCPRRCLLLSVSLLVLGCGSGLREPLEIHEDSYDEIKIGMTRTELEHMFGPGAEMSRDEAFDLFGELEGERFDASIENAPTGMRWKNGDFAIYVLLVDETVVAKAETGHLTQR